jgi:uncharacterized protein YggE
MYMSKVWGKMKKNGITSILKVFVVSFIFFVGPVIAQESPEKLQPSIRTSGEAVVTAKPDRAQIDIGVVTQAATSQAAAEQNAKQIENTLSSLRGQLGAGADIKTIGYTLQPVYRYPREGGEPTITGYTATNTVRVTTDDLNAVGKVLDAATGTGANRIQNLRFTLKDKRAAQTQALREAAIEARGKAEALASELALKIVRVLSVVESGPVVIPVRDLPFARAEAATTQIEPGTIEIRASVVLTVEARP